MLQSAEGLYYTTTEGTKVLDAVSGLWCVNLGHKPKELLKATQRAAERLDFSPAYQVSYPEAFELADKINRTVWNLDGSVFFTNSGSEAVETALKIAIAKKRLEGARGDLYLVGRQRGYHGVCFGGLSVGGIEANRQMFGNLYPFVDHLPATHVLEKQAFSKGEPEWGQELADELLGIIDKRGAENIAAVIVEPVCGSAGVLVPPKGYLERLAKHCADHSICLIFDEVITSLGRVGYGSAALRFGVMPDLMVLSKGLSNGIAALGAVVAKKGYLEAFLQRQTPPHLIEFAHGYTFSAHPVAVAAGLATLDIYQKQDVFKKVRQTEGYFGNLLHTHLANQPDVVDVRHIGFMGAVELAPTQAVRSYKVYVECFKRGLLVRQTGDTIALAPPLVMDKPTLELVVKTLAEVLRAIR